MISLKLSGGPQLAKALEMLSPSKARGVLNKMLIESGEHIRQRAEEMAPVEPGKPDLKDHISIRSISDKEIGDPNLLGKRAREDSEAIAAIGPEREFFYAWYVEFGTVFAGAQPFMRPAFDAKAPEALRTLQEQMWAYLRQQSQRAAGTNTGRSV